MFMEQSPEYHYQLLRASATLFEKPLDQLNEEQRQRAETQARNSCDLNERVLCTNEAAAVVIGAEILERAEGEIRSRFENELAFIADLERNGMDLERLRIGLERELRFDAVMQRVVASADSISDAEVEIYFHLHPQKFTQPELRQASHILKTISEGDHQDLRRQMEKISASIRAGKRTFADMALRHSECPTALEGGSLGRVKPGQLYPELDRALFSMQSGEISPVVESEIGMHLLTFDGLTPARSFQLAEVSEKVRAYLQSRRDRQLQQEWLKKTDISG